MKTLIYFKQILIWYIKSQIYIEKIYILYFMLLTCGVFAYVISGIETVLSSKFDSETNS
jgi:hypothetical protein